MTAVWDRHRHCSAGRELAAASTEAVELGCYRLQVKMPGRAAEAVEPQVCTIREARTSPWKKRPGEAELLRLQSARNSMIDHSHRPHQHRRRRSRRRCLEARWVPNFYLLCPTCAVVLARSASFARLPSRYPLRRNSGLQRLSGHLRPVRQVESQGNLPLWEQGPLQPVGKKMGLPRSLSPGRMMRRSLHQCGHAPPSKRCLQSQGHLEEAPFEGLPQVPWDVQKARNLIDVPRSLERPKNPRLVEPAAAAFSSPPFAAAVAVEGSPAPKSATPWEASQVPAWAPWAWQWPGVAPAKASQAALANLPTSQNRAAAAAGLQVLAGPAPAWWVHLLVPSGARS